MKLSPSTHDKSEPDAVDVVEIVEVIVERSVDAEVNVVDVVVVGIKVLGCVVCCNVVDLEEVDVIVDTVVVVVKVIGEADDVNVVVAGFEEELT